MHCGVLWCPMEHMLNSQDAFLRLAYFVKVIQYYDRSLCNENNGQLKHTRGTNMFTYLEVRSKVTVNHIQ